MKILTVTLEKAGNEVHGRVDAPGFLHTAVGGTIGEIEANLRELLSDYLENEGKHSSEWVGVGINDIEFNYTTPHPTE